MIRLFANHRTAPNLLMLILVVIGLFGLPGLRRETLQQLPVDEIRVSVAYPGASTEDVDEAICGRIEEAIEGIENIDEIRSEAKDSIGLINVLLKEGTDAYTSQRDIQSAVDALDDLPELAEQPIVERVGDTFPVASIAVAGNLSPGDLRTFCLDLKSRLLMDPDVSIASLSGFSERQFAVEVSAAMLRQHALSAQDIADAISRQSIDQPAGTIYAEGADVVVRVTEQRRTLAQLEDLVVIGGDPGTELRLGDIATIRDTFDLEEEQFAFDGLRAGLLEVSKTSDQDGLVVVDAMKRFIDEVSVTAPAGVTLTLTQDSTTIVSDRLVMLVKNAGQGLVLVFATLWLFFGARLGF